MAEEIIPGTKKPLTLGCDLRRPFMKERDIAEFHFMRAGIRKRGTSCRQLEGG